MISAPRQILERTQEQGLAGALIYIQLAPCRASPRDIKMRFWCVNEEFGIYLTKFLYEIKFNSLECVLRVLCVIVSHPRDVLTAGKATPRVPMFGAKARCAPTTLLKSADGGLQQLQKEQHLRARLTGLLLFAIDLFLIVDRDGFHEPSSG